MKPLMLDENDCGLLEKARASRGSSDRPRGWHDLVDELSVRLSGSGARAYSAKEALASDAFLFAWHVSREACLAAALGGRLLYLCWGGLGRSGAKGFAERLVLRRARALFVNDASTAAEIRSAVGRRSLPVRYCVDGTFFDFAPPETRESHLLCTSVNDRDPAVLLALAQAGQRVHWIVDDATLRGASAGAHANLRLKPRVPFRDLREAYQSCSVFVMPLRDTSHAAGQTTILEALACGTPVVASRGRGPEIFASFPTVELVDGDDPADWSAAIERARRHDLPARRESRRLLEEAWHYDRVLDDWEATLRRVCAAQDGRDRAA